MRIRLAAGVVAVALAGLTACGSDDDPTLDARSEETATSEEQDGGASVDEDHNEADVAFAQSMIPHHEQAIAMAQLAGERADSQEVLDLAARIEAAQQPEIEQMEAWLEEWGEDGDGMSGMDMEDDGEMQMEGGMSDEDMTSLEAATGAEFDQMFLEMMIEHHRGAISMAETEVAEGTNGEAIQLAQTIMEDQEAEIAEMEALLDQLG